MLTSTRLKPAPPHRQSALRSVCGAGCCQLLPPQGKCQAGQCAPHPLTPISSRAPCAAPDVGAELAAPYRLAPGPPSRPRVADTGHGEHLGFARSCWCPRTAHVLRSQAGGKSVSPRRLSAGFKPPAPDRVFLRSPPQPLNTPNPNPLSRALEKQPCPPSHAGEKLQDLRDAAQPFLP